MNELQLPRTLPRKLQIRPHYVRADDKKQLMEIVLDYYNGELKHPLIFCAGIEHCFYADADCLYGLRKCYFE